MIPNEDIERVLVVVAHPDDVDFGAGGTVAGWTEMGIEVAYCIVTFGDAGGFDPEIPRDEMPAIRRAEQHAAARELGVRDVTFLGYPDGRLEVSLRLRQDITRCIRRWRPDRVLTQSPVRNLDRIVVSHPDHLATAEAALCAVYPDARNPYAFPSLLVDEGLEPHTVREVWLQGHPEPNHAVDVTVTLARKEAALRRHSSQLPDPERVLEEVRRWLRGNAQAHGFGDDAFAETFRVVSTG